MSSPPDIVIITPYIVLFIGAVFHLLLVLIRLIIPEEFLPVNKIIRIIYRFIQSIFIGIYGILGIICLYTSITWIGGVIGFSDIWYHIPSVILGIIIGIEYFGVAYLIKGSRTLMGIGIIAVASVIYLFVYYIPPLDRISQAAIVASYVLGSVIVLTVIWTILEELMGDKSNFKPLWSLKPNVYKKYIWPIDLIIWIAVIIELLFKMIGSSTIQFWLI